MYIISYLKLKYSSLVQSLISRNCLYSSNGALAIWMKRIPTKQATIILVTHPKTTIPTIFQINPTYSLTKYVRMRTLTIMKFGLQSSKLVQFFRGLWLKINPKRQDKVIKNSAKMRPLQQPIILVTTGMLLLLPNLALNLKMR